MSHTVASARSLAPIKPLPGCCLQWAEASGQSSSGGGLKK